MFSSDAGCTRYPISEPRVHFEAALNRIEPKPCVAVGRLGKSTGHRSEERERERERERETRVRTFISQITSSRRGERSSTPAAKGNLWPRSKSYIDVESITDKCPRFEENPVKQWGRYRLLPEETTFSIAAELAERLRAARSR
jgi:hypothetical protein